MAEAAAVVMSGRCLCGAVRFTIRGALAPVVGCHCAMCRRQTGHFLASTNVAEADVTVEGADHVRWYISSGEARRGFCDTCGSVLFWQRLGSDRIAVAMGALDRPTGASWGEHIFVAEKGDYYEIEPGVRQVSGDH
jgi:hypothetical protein